MSDPSNVWQEPDTMRRNPRKLGTAELHSMDTVKALGQHMHAFIRDLPTTSAEGAHCYGIAQQRIEEAVMWAVKGLTG